MISVEDARKYLKDEDGDPNRATLVLSEEDTGSLTTVGTVVQRMDRLVKATNKRNGGVQKGGGSGSGLGIGEAIVGVSAIKALGRAAAVGFKKLAGVGAAAYGGYNVYQSISRGDKVSFFDSVIAGAGLGSVLGPAGIIAGGLIGAAASGLWNKRDKIKRGWSVALDYVKASADSAIGWIKTTWNSAIEGAKSAGELAKQMLSTTWESIKGVVEKYRGQVGAWFESQGVKLSDWMAEVGTQLREAINVNSLRKVAWEWLQSLKKWFATKFSFLGSLNPFGGSESGGGSEGQNGGQNVRPNVDGVSDPSSKYAPATPAMPQMPESSYAGPGQQANPMAPAQPVPSGRQMFDTTESGMSGAATNAAAKPWMVPKLGGDKNTPTFVTQGMAGERAGNAANENSSFSTDAPQKREAQIEGNNHPYYIGGRVKVGGEVFNYGSGGAGRGAIPFGQYPVNIGKGDIGPIGNRIGSIATIGGPSGTINDPMYPGAPRRGVQIHPNSSSNLERLYTQGCFSVSREQWPAFKRALLAESARNPNGLWLNISRSGEATIGPRPQEQNSKPRGAESRPSNGANENQSRQNGGVSRREAVAPQTQSEPTNGSARTPTSVDSAPSSTPSAQPEPTRAGPSTPRPHENPSVVEPRADATQSEPKPVASLSTASDQTPEPTTLDEAGKAPSKQEASGNSDDKPSEGSDQSPGVKHKRINIDSIPTVHPDVNLAVLNQSKAA